MMDVFVVIVAVGFVVFAIFQGRERLQDMESLARVLGLTDIRRIWMESAIEGSWRGYRTTLRYASRGKGLKSAVAEIGVVSPSQLSIVPRHWWNVTLFGGPLLQQFNGPLVVRGNDTLFAERLVYDPDLQQRLTALTGAQEKVEILADVVRVQRNASRAEHEMLVEAFNLATAIVEKLELPPR